MPPDAQSLAKRASEKGGEMGYHEGMNRKAYPTDLTDTEWIILNELLPPAKLGGRPRSSDLREILNAIFYRLRTGCAWEMLPHDWYFPPEVWINTRGWV